MMDKLAVQRLLCVAVCLWSVTGSSVATELPRNSVYQIDVTLTDQEGQTSRWRDAASPTGGPRIVGMFYSRCDYVCPMLFEAVKNIEANLPTEARQRLHIGMITLDPARDDTPALKKTALQRGGDPARWSLYRTPNADVRKLAGVLGVQYRQLSNGEFNHSTAMILLDKQGNELARTESIAKIDPVFFKAVLKASTAP